MQKSKKSKEPGKGKRQVRSLYKSVADVAQNTTVVRGHLEDGGVEAERGPGAEPWFGSRGRAPEALMFSVI